VNNSLTVSDSESWLIKVYVPLDKKRPLQRRFSQPVTQHTALELRTETWRVNKNTSLACRHLLSWSSGLRSTMRPWLRVSLWNKKPHLSLRNPRDGMLTAVACTVCEIFAFEL